MLYERQTQVKHKELYKSLFVLYAQKAFAVYYQATDMYNIFDSVQHKARLLTFNISAFPNPDLIKHRIDSKQNSQK